MGIAQEAAIGFAKQLHKDDQAEVIDFDSQVRILSALHERRRGAREGDSRDHGQRLDVALQRALHRAEGTEEVEGGGLGRHPPPGDRAAVGRRRHLQPDRIRPGAGSRQALRGRDLLDRSAPGGNRPPRVQGSGVRAEAALAPKPAAAPTSRPTRASCRRSTSGIWDELASQYAIAYSSTQPQARRRVAPDPGPAGPPERHGAHQAGLLRSRRDRNAP